jgi:Ca2+-binding EF-hand superfamily protein
VGGGDGEHMHCRNKWLPKAIVVCGALAILLVVPAGSFATSAMSTIDTDHDGTIDLAEANAAAIVLFDKLDTDKDGTLDIEELEGHVTKEQLAADRDGDKKLSKAEYLALVEATFKAIDTDGDGTVDNKEFKTAAGRALL